MFSYRLRRHNGSFIVPFHSWTALGNSLQYDPPTARTHTHTHTSSTSQPFIYLVWNSVRKIIDQNLLSDNVSPFYLGLRPTSGLKKRVIKSRRMRWAGHVARMGEERGLYRVLVGKSEGKRPLGRPRRRWVDNIRTDLQEVGCGYMNWIGLAQDRDRWRTLVSAVMNLRFLWNVGNFLTSSKPVSCSRRTLHHGVSK